MLPLVFIITFIVVFALYQFKIIDIKISIIVFLSVTMLSFGLGIVGFLLQTLIHITIALVHFSVPLLIIGAIIYGIYWIKRNF